MFAKGDSEVVANGCAMSIIEILRYTFPECLNGQDIYDNKNQFLHKNFILPLIDVINPVKGGQSLAQQQGGCYCLRRLVEFLIKEDSGLVTMTPLCDELIEMALKYKVPHKHFVEMLGSLLTYFQAGVAGLTSNVKGLLKYTILTIESIMKKQTAKTQTIFTSYDAKKTVRIGGKQLEDITTLCRF